MLSACLGSGASIEEAIRDCEWSCNRLPSARP
jgi:hypothetical protein